MSCRAEFDAYVAGMVIVLLGIGVVDRAPVSAATRGQLPAEANDVRWDLAEAFEFRWTAAERSAKIVNGEGPISVEPVLAISAEVRFGDSPGMVSIDARTPRIIDVSDGNGDALLCQFSQTSSARCYQELFWQPSSESAASTHRRPFEVTVGLSRDPNEAASSPLTVFGYIYVVYADNVISCDVPFDPNGGWRETEATSDLQVCVDPATPPCPERLRYVRITPLPGTSKGLGYFPFRPTTSVPMYKYATWVRTKSGNPVMALCDAAVYCHRDDYPLSDYAIMWSELYDSERQTSAAFTTRWAASGPSDIRGTYCWGHKEQEASDAYDTIRHVIVVHPMEAKIPFVLRDVPIP